MWLFGLFPLRPVPNSLFSFLFIQRRDINGPLPSSLPRPVCDRSFCVQTAKRIHSRRRPLHSLDLHDGHCALPSVSSLPPRNSSDGNAVARGQQPFLADR